MLRTMKDILVTLGIVIGIGVVIILVPVIGAMLTGIGTLFLIIILEGVIYQAVREEGNPDR